LLEVFMSSFKYRNKSKLECHRRNSQMVDSGVVGVRCALPTFNQ
jgi:hypothetical protein